MVVGAVGAVSLRYDWRSDHATALAAHFDIVESFGFSYEGTMRKRNFERGRRVDLLMWGLLKDDR